MASSTAGASKIAVLDGLISLLDSISIFTDHVYGGYHPDSSIRVGKFILIHLVQDRYLEATTSEDDHAIDFNLLVRFRGDLSEDPKDQMDSFIDAVGLVEDKLKENYYNAGVWEDIKINRINYTFGQVRDFINYSGLLNITVRAQW